MPNAFIVLPLLAAAITVTVTNATAQTARPTEFPADAAPLTEDGLRQRLADKVYVARLADGSTWRLEYKSNGYYFFNTSAGGRGSGKWNTARGQLCTGRAGEANCSEARLLGDEIYFKRVSTGEVVPMAVK